MSGFSNKAVVTIGAMFILSRSLVKTGFLEVFADFMYNHVGNNKWITITTFLFIVAICLILLFYYKTDLTFKLLHPLLDKLPQKFCIKVFEPISEIELSISIISGFPEFMHGEFSFNEKLKLEMSGGAHFSGFFCF